MRRSPIRRPVLRIVTVLAVVAAVGAGTLSVTSTGAAADDASSAREQQSTSDEAPVARRRSKKRRPAGFTRQVTMNVAFDMRAARQRRDIRRAARNADVIGWQEITRWSQTRAIGRLKGWGTYWPGGFRRDGRVWRGSINASPISWRWSVWKLIHSGTRLASREVPGVCRDRYLTFVVLQHRGSGKKILRWNIHFVPDAMNSKHARLKSRRRAAWRRQQRTVTRLLDRVAKWHYAAVIGGGDINWRSRFAGNRVSYDTNHKRIDYLTHVPGKRVRAWRPKFTEMNSDHDKVRVAYSLYR